MITFPLCQMPPFLLLKVLNQMNFRSLCRLRQSGKKLHNFVETNRFAIQAGSRNNFVFYAEVNSASESVIKYLVKQINDEQKEEYLLASQMKELFQTKNANLTDPFMQLSALRFLDIHLVFHITPEKNIKCMEVIENLRILIKKGRFLCDGFIFKNTSNLKILDQFLPILKYDFLTINENSQLSDFPLILSKPIRRLNLFNLNEKPSRLMPFVKDLRGASICITVKSENALVLLEFLKEIRENRESMGKLRTLYLILPSDFPHLFNVSFLKCIYRGIDYHNYTEHGMVIDTFVFKMEFNQGVVYIFQSNDRYLLRIIKEPITEKNILPGLLFRPEMYEAASAVNDISQIDEICAKYTQAL